MASVVKQIVTRAAPSAAWDAIRNIGALHTRLVPGFVVDTRLEPIVALDEAARRLVWSAEGARTTHYNAAVQVHEDAGGARIVWTADFLPDSLAGDIAAAMTAGMAAMQGALDRLDAVSGATPSA